MKREIITVMLVMYLLVFSGFTFFSVVRGESDNQDDLSYVPGEILVKFKDNIQSSDIYSENGYVHTGLESIDDLNQEYSISSYQNVFKQGANGDLSNVFKLSFSEEKDVLDIADEYSSINNVVYAEPNYVYQICATPNDPNFDLQWGLNQSNDCDIDAPEAWELETGNSEVTIAVVDSGVDYDHPDLEDNIWINEDETEGNGVDDDDNGYIDDVCGWDFANNDNDPIDDNGHGTHCAGIIGAKGDNNIGISGVCWNCRIMPVKALDNSGSGSLEDLAHGIKYAADNGADVISNSWSLRTRIPSSPIIEAAVRYAYSKGCVIVFAAGNNDDDAGYYSPQNMDETITVAATDSSDEKASFSNYGYTVDVAAPGKDIYSTIPTASCFLSVQSGEEQLARYIESQENDVPQEAESKFEYSGDYPVTKLSPKTEYELSLMNQNPQPTRPTSSIPSEFSWLDYAGGDWTTPAKDQGDCGSCWAFSSLGALEAAINIASENPATDIDLSEQYLLSCLSGSCDGGLMSRAIRYIKSTDSGSNGNGINGVPIESCMPYTATDSVPCSDKCEDWDYYTNPPAEDNKLWQIQDYGVTSISEDSESDWNILKSWIIDKGPIIADIYASIDFSSWGSSHHNPEDVYEQDDSGPTDHGIVICGWKDDSSVTNGGYWICKNSWGTDWGYNGFFNIAYGCNSVGTRDVTWVTATEWANYDNMSGTSMACPFVAGVAGLILSNNPDLSPSTVKNILKASSDPVDTDYYIGEGRLNGYQALEYANNMMSTSSTGTPADFYVDDDFGPATPGFGEDHFRIIQNAIDNASSGDRIIVYEGTYSENIDIDRTIDLFGEDTENTIIEGDNTRSTITILADNVDFSTFTVKNSGSTPNDAAIKISGNNVHVVESNIKNSKNGIYIDNSNQIIVEHNTITNNDNGIFLSNSNNNKINKNVIHDNRQNGIFLDENCDQNIISNNEIYSNNQNGLYLQDRCDQNNISSNKIYENDIVGVRIENSSLNNIINNTKINNNGFYGLIITGSNNTVDGNTLSKNDKHGVFLLADDNTIISDNTIKGNEYDGIRLQNSTNEIIKDNTVKENSRYGVYVNYYATGNRIYNNYFEDNKYNAKDISSRTNYWYTSKTSGSNIIKGPYLGGNYWSDYTGTDTNGDGIGDSSYSSIIGNDITDAFPLVYRLPIADAGESYSASVGETIIFDASDSYSPDGTITSYSWDFGDDTTGSGETTTHSYQTPGKYTVTLTVLNSNGGTDTDTISVTITKDNSPPVINVLQHGFSNTHSNVYIFKANVTDNVRVKNVTIEYWYPGSGIRNVEMEEIQTNIYRKMITTDQVYDKVYCVIYANDTSENLVNTKKPFVDLGGPYENCTVLENITFNASASFDLDGNITEYKWDFGDGATSKGVIAYHKFNADGVYDVVLTVKDNDGNINSKKTTLRIYPQINITVTNKTRSNLEIEYNINLNEKFSAYDTNGDGKVDAFVDPNEILNVLHSGALTIEGDECFLLSVNNDISKVFLWNTAENKAINVTYQQGIISDSQGTIDKTTGDRIVIVKVDKAIWTYFEVQDYYPNTVLKGIKRSDDSDIPAGNYWRKNNKIYVLDDPDTVYKIVYNTEENEGSSGLTLKDPVFYPTDRILNKQNRSIIITYNVAVDIETAVLRHLESSWVQNITDQLVTSDYKTYTYTPPNDLTDGMYQINIAVKKGNQSKENSAVFDFYSYTITEDKGEIPLFMIIILIGFTIGMTGLAIFIIKKKNINFESFIYFKNKKIIPFFKPVVFGPLQIDVDNEKVSRAEFYVNGALKETLTEKPFKWTWNETTFMKHNIETKIYNENGESHSTGDMTFFVFNPPRLFK